MKLKKSCPKISEAQIREIIILRDASELSQQNLYQLASYVMGWKVKHIHNLSPEEGKQLVQYLKTMKQEPRHPLFKSASSE